MPDDTKPDAPPPPAADPDAKDAAVKRSPRVDKIVRILERLTGKSFDAIDPETLPRLVL